MMTHGELRERALSNPKVKAAYERQDAETDMLDIFLKAGKMTGPGEHFRCVLGISLEKSYHQDIVWFT